ncbi:MAG: DNA recombination protein RmuC [Gammaproteobacteria bacterium]|nr:DNA recombination protein RmuC [Gammaproteobacteria bacterium]MBU1969359.1 DNA recombination protein RmuC [Gammaproteobacteria bacterium]
MSETLLLLLSILTLLGVIAAMFMLRNQPARTAQVLEQQHRAMLTDLNDGLNKQGDRLIAAQAAESERLRSAVGEELRATREAIAALRTEMLAQMLEKLAEQGRADQKLIQESFNNASQHLRNSIETLSKTVDGRLEQIGGKVNERLDEGFKKTNETFVSVMARLATIDEAQKKIDGLTTNVVSLQELLGDKRSRGAFGEVQLEGLVRNILSPQAYEMQYTLPNGSRADCVLKLPEPTGMVAVDSKFPLENYHRMFDAASPAERLVAERQFKADVKKHVEDISSKYIIPNVTSDGAVMFIPAEAVFAEIHAHHSDVVDYAMQRRVWIVSPTTLMAVLNTARAVMKDVETRKQVHIIKDELGKLGKDFGRFDERMKKLAEHIRQANKDVDDVQISSRKITEQFAKIERVELDHPAALSDRE